MIDVMKHKLVTTRGVSLVGLERAKDADTFKQGVVRRIADDVGGAVTERYPPDWTTDSSPFAEVKHTVFVFSPAELAQLVSDVRDKAIEETLALAGELTPEQENPNEQ